MLRFLRLSGFKRRLILRLVIKFKRMKIDRISYTYKCILLCFLLIVVILIGYSIGSFIE